MGVAPPDYLGGFHKIQRRVAGVLYRMIPGAWRSPIHPTEQARHSAQSNTQQTAHNTMRSTATKVSAALIVALVVSSAYSSSSRCSGGNPEVQRCGNELFFCPVDRLCKPRSKRCLPDSDICRSQPGVEENCRPHCCNQNSYQVLLGRTSLLSRKKRLPELNHQLITYRGFTYEFGCDYGVQILDLNDPNYKYQNKTVKYTNKGASECRYNETLIFTNKWSSKYRLFTNNCQHFARALSEYLTTAECGSRRRSTNLDEFAESIFASCTIDGYLRACV